MSNLTIMKHEQRIEELLRRVSALEAEVTILRMNTNKYVPTTVYGPIPVHWKLPEIWCNLNGS